MSKKTNKTNSDAKVFVDSISNIDDGNYNFENNRNLVEPKAVDYLEKTNKKADKNSK